MQWLQRRNSRKKSQHWLLFRETRLRLLEKFINCQHNAKYAGPQARQHEGAAIALDGGMADTAIYTQAVNRRGRGKGVFRSGLASPSVTARGRSPHGVAIFRCGRTLDT